ncbi:uncharacterized protein SPAPADRAFT_143048 [Spathaspora passalidarum NRRL Y-27907]|uniref:Uncharacterized protein n=1 Tax=Spathaspora passalidarum (strain NRRL Y-27907 / 11-Y1) TaxID=619300 RepID=G3AU69_SPAPN|nr:uncharacterized protein SPAPADRAFT_143048 [Spathaspora passalidarum NRRL Y-27907]EGW30445.1 hypothetical protein SPAPADRAFT_143048 [Spathaspora passalidarum NRRL Y-27907]
MESTRYNLEENTLTPRESKSDYVDLDECTCASCNHWKHLHRRQSRFLLLGIIIPLIWLYNIAQIVFGLYFKNHNPRSISQFVQIGNREESLISNVKLDHGYIDNHMKIRKEMYTGIGHTLLAIIIYGLLVFMAVACSADYIRVGEYYGQ